jgi:hypothetical protein
MTQLRSAEDVGDRLVPFGGLAYVTHYTRLAFLPPAGPIRISNTHYGNYGVYIGKLWVVNPYSRAGYLRISRR